MAPYQGGRWGKCQRAISHSKSTPTEPESERRVAFVVVGRIPGPRIKRVRNWRMEFRQHRAGNGMNGLADWPHFYLNVAEVGIIIGGRGRATLFPLIDVLFSTLARSAQ